MVVLGLLASQLPGLKFDYELENFFPQNDPDLTYYREFSETFGHDNDYLLLGFDAPNGIFDATFLNAIHSGLNNISNLEPTANIISPTSFKTIIGTPIGKIPIPLLHLDMPGKLASDSVKLYNHPFHRGMFISASGQTLKVILVHKRFVEKSDADAYVAEVTRTFRDFPTRLRMAGKANAQTAFVNAVQEDFSRFLIMALVIIFALLLLLFRHLGLVFIALSIAALAVVGTIGLMAATGKAIDVLSSLVPTILLVVAMSDLIHLYAHVQRNYVAGADLKTAINTAVRHVGLATLLTSFTTAVGFLTLITINVKPVVDLGIYAAMGIMLTLLITYMLFPSTIFLSKPKLLSGKPGTWTTRFLSKLLQTVIAKRKLIMIASLLFLVVGLFGLSKLEIDAYLVNDLPNDNQVKADFVFFDREFVGSKPFTLSMWLTDSTQKIYSKEIIIQIDQVEGAIRKHMNVGDLVSPATVVRFANQSMHKGASKSYQLPESDREWQKALKWIGQMHPEQRQKKVSDRFQAQITGFYKDLGSKDAAAKQKKLMQHLDQIIDPDLLGYRLTGTSLLVDKSHELLSLNLIKGLLIAMGIVALIVGIMFRSVRMIVITLVPNLLPLLLIAAIMGFFQIPLSLSTSVIFAISFGIVVDDTIHFLSQFKSEMQSGKPKAYAIKAAYYSSGHAIVTTTFVLTCGFLIFCFSNFNTSFYMGLFVSLSFVAALVADLVLLPLLIMLWLPEQKQ